MAFSSRARVATPRPQELVDAFGTVCSAYAALRCVQMLPGFTSRGSAHVGSKCLSARNAIPRPV